MWEIYWCAFVDGDGFLCFIGLFPFSFMHYSFLFGVVSICNFNLINSLVIVLIVNEGVLKIKGQYKNSLMHYSFLLGVLSVCNILFRLCITLSFSCLFYKHCMHGFFQYVIITISS